MQSKPPKGKKKIYLTEWLFRIKDGRTKHQGTALIKKQVVVTGKSVKHKDNPLYMKRALRGMPAREAQKMELVEIRYISEVGYVN